MKLQVLAACLLLGALTTGCTSAPPAESEELSPGSLTTTTVPTEPTPPTPRNTTQPAAAPPAQTSSPPANESLPPEKPTQKAPPPQDSHHESAGWVNTTPGETTSVVKMPIQILAGAQNVTLAATVNTQLGPVGTSPANAPSYKIELVDPTGKVVKTATFETTDPTSAPSLKLDANAELIQHSGEYVFALTIERGISDGASVGQSYAMSADVKY